jgi:polysaccharide pyruvyl transferase WcaK-like protein
VDHGEAYGNQGDEAMLLNALERLARYLGPCEFILPGEPGKPLPAQLPKVETVLPPHGEFARWSRQFDRFLGLCRRLPLLGRLVREPQNTTVWKMAALWFDVRISLWRCGVLKSPGEGLQPFLEALKDCDLFYGVGAADFNDFWLQGVIYKSWLYTLVSHYVRVSAVSAQGIGPLETKWARRRMAKAFSCLDLLSFRDFSLSQEIVEAENINQVRYQIVGDEALTLPTGNQEAIEALLRSSGLPAGESFIAVHFRTTDYTQDTSFLEAQIAALLDHIAEIVPHFFVFFPMSHHLHSGIDVDYGAAIKHNMKRKERFCVAPFHADVRVIKGAVGLARYSMGLSYHVHVFSFSQGHPAIILFTGDYYRYKSEGLVSFYGKPSVAFDLAKTGNDRILAAIQELEDDYPVACKHIERVNEQQLFRVNDWTLREIAAMMQKRCAS